MRIMIPLLVISRTKLHLNRFLGEKNNKEVTVTTMVTPIASEYSIDQIREIKREVRVHQVIKKRYVFEEFDRSSIEAQNAFLKLLEEPPENIEFILVVANPYLLLPTIVSRTKIVRLEKQTLDQENERISNAIRKFIVKKDFGAIDFELFSSSTKEETEKIMIQLCLFFRERFFDDPLSAPIVRKILKLYRLLHANNLNPQLAIDHLLIFIGQTYTINTR